MSISRGMLSALLFGAIFISGVWLGLDGRPRSNLMLTVHKLVALAALALLVTVAYGLRSDGLGTGVWAAVAVTVLLFVLTIATGGLLSTENAPPTVVLRLHQVGPVLTAAANAVAMVLLLNHD